MTKDAAIRPLNKLKNNAMKYAGRKNGFTRHQNMGAVMAYDIALVIVKQITDIEAQAEIQDLYQAGRDIDIKNGPQF